MKTHGRTLSVVWHLKLVYCCFKRYDFTLLGQKLETSIHTSPNNQIVITCNWVFHVPELDFSSHPCHTHRFVLRYTKSIFYSHTQVSCQGFSGIKSLGFIKVFSCLYCTHKLYCLLKNITYKFVLTDVRVNAQTETGLKEHDWLHKPFSINCLLLKMNKRLEDFFSFFFNLMQSKYWNMHSIWGPL